MATFTILNDSAPYYTIRVEFGPYSFDQMIISSLTGPALDAFLQSYADEYEEAYVAPLADSTDPLPPENEAVS
jgi:hypothetical protein